MGKLADTAIRSPKLSKGRYVDGDGLMLAVTESGRKTWVLRYQLAGKRRDRGLGSYPDVGLQEARELAAAARRLSARGIDPIDHAREAQKAAKPLPSFKEIAQLVIKDAQAKSTNAKVRYQWDYYLGPAYCGDLLDRPVNEISTLVVAATLRPVWRSKPEVARKLYPAIRRVFDRARVILRDEHGIIMQSNPALWSDLKSMGFETPKALTKGHHPSLPYEHTSEFVGSLRERQAVAALGLEFLMLTNVRTAAVLKAKWEEFNLDRALWTIPLANLKDREHRTEAFEVPLSPRAVEILKKAVTVRTGAYVFPGQKGDQPLSNMAFLTLLKRMNGTQKPTKGEPKPKWIDPVSGRPVTAHGFRATFRTWAEEVATFPHAAIEHAMGHRVGGKVERAYNRTTLLDLRRKLMDAWAAYCEPKAKDENVTPLRKKT